jgi:DNA-binding NarL/FixJ family response regulator
MKKISVAIVDDHKMIREMWTQMFAGNNDIEITGESGTLKEAVEMIKVKRPDIVLLDINFPEGSGLDAVPQIRKFSPGTRIIAVSMHNQPVYAKKMLNLGAKGYITKNSSHEEIFKAIETVMQGGEYICEEIKDIISEQIIHDTTEAYDTKDLSLREIEIVKLIKEGLSSKEISLRLFISTRTAEAHRHNILKKLHLKNTASLINFITNTDLNLN